MISPERFDWVWYGVDENGESHVSLGRWQKHPCQFRYKFADVQPTEHDRADTAAIREAALREAAKTASARCRKCSGEGWLWGAELDSYSHPHVGMSDDTRYSCDGDGCMASTAILALIQKGADR